MSTTERRAERLIAETHDGDLEVALAIARDLSKHGAEQRIQDHAWGAVAKLIRALTSREDFEVRIRVPGPYPLLTTKRLYLILQEALTDADVYDARVEVRQIPPK